MSSTSYKNRKTKTRKTIETKTRKMRRKRKTRKGGFLFNQTANINGVNISKNTGQKRYNWTTGKWDSYVCYGVGPFRGCKIVPAPAK